MPSSVKRSRKIMRLILDDFAVILECFGAFKHSSPLRHSQPNLFWKIRKKIPCFYRLPTLIKPAQRQIDSIYFYWSGLSIYLEKKYIYIDNTNTGSRWNQTFSGPQNCLWKLIKPTQETMATTTIIIIRQELANTVFCVKWREQWRHTRAHITALLCWQWKNVRAMAMILCACFCVGLPGVGIFK